MIKPDSAEAKYMHAFTEFEKKMNIQVLNKDDNKSIIKKHYKKDEVQPWMKKYASMSRHLWRMQWFFEFVGQTLKAIVEQKENKISKIAGHTYATYLAPHHNSVLATIAKAAVVAVNSRSKFIGGLVKQ